MVLLRRFLTAMSRQMSIILALAAYENDRKSTSSSVGSWESLINPFQMMLFFIGMRVGFRFLLSGGNAFGGSASIYFNIIIFIKANKQLRLKRFKLKNGNKDLFNFLNDKQMTDVQKIKFCNYVVVNEKNLNFLKKNLFAIINRYE